MPIDYSTGHEYCPKCGEYWNGEIPHHPQWIEYRCDNPECRYAKGEDLYTGEGMVIRESDKEASIRDLVNQVRHLYD